jgi:hypothetical protein
LLASTIPIASLYFAACEPIGTHITISNLLNCKCLWF